MSKTRYSAISFLPTKCLGCGVEFQALKWELARGMAKFCGHKCRLRAVGKAFHVKYRAAFPGTRAEKRKAKQLFDYAVKCGKFSKPTNCQDCNKPHSRLHGHHEDYSKPYDVVWLCPSCHKKRHTILR